MKMMVERVASFFLEKGVVATMRSFKYTPGIVVKVKTPYGVYKGMITGVFENTDRTRARFLEISGFDNVDEWLETATKLHGRVPPWIVVVRRIEDEV